MRGLGSLKRRGAGRELKWLDDSDLDCRCCPFSSGESVKAVPGMRHVQDTPRCDQRRGTKNDELTD